MAQLLSIERGFLPSSARADGAQSRLAIAVVAALAIAFAATAPFAKVQLGAMFAFIPIQQSALVLCDLLTAALLIWQHRLLRSSALLALGCGYLFTALVTIVHTFTFPGLFAAQGLFDSGPQTTAWLYMYWHGGFPAFIVAYAMLKNRPEETAPGATALAMAATVAAAVGGAAVLVWSSTPGRDYLPPIMLGHHYTEAMAGVVSTVWALSALAAIVVWRRKPHSLLDLWLVVVMCAWTFDIALSAVLNAGRFDLGFYAGRMFGLLAAMLVLAALLAEYRRLYGHLASLNELLERRVTQRTGELEASHDELRFEIAERQRAEMASREARQRLAGIIDSAMDAIITVDDRYNIVLFNKAAEVIFGYSSEEVLGKPLAPLLPERFRAEHSRDLERFGATASTPRRMSAQRVVSGLRRNGEEFPIDASISHATLDGRRFFTVVLRDITERVRVEAALRRSKEELILTASLSSAAQEHEKRRVSRELHDELGQLLAAMKLDIEWLTDHVDPANPAKTARVASIRQLTDDAVTAVRRIAADLRPIMLDDLGLVAAVQWLAATFEQRHGVACDLAVNPPEFDVPDPQATAVFRIVQEALSNVARHANASRVEIDLRLREDHLSVVIADNGRGFDLNQRRREDAFGILGLRERVHLMRGRLVYHSAPGQGTRIEALIPLENGRPGEPR